MGACVHVPFRFDGVFVKATMGFPRLITYRLYIYIGLNIFKPCFDQLAIVFDVRWCPLCCDLCLAGGPSVFKIRLLGLSCPLGRFLEPFWTFLQAV